MRRGALLLATTLFAVTAAAVGARASTPLPPHEPDTLLVGFEHNLDPALRAQAHANVGGIVLNTFASIDVDVVKLPAWMDPSEGARRYSQQRGVAFAELNWVNTLHSTPNDPYFDELWGLDNTGQLTQAFTGPSSCCALVNGNGQADVNAPEGWDLAFGPGSFDDASGTRVGIIDSGIESSHPDLAGLTVACARATGGSGSVSSGCADDNDHGTHVAGTIAALANNGTGVAGVAPNAELAVFKAFNSAGQGYDADIVAGINWMVSTGQPRVINMSFGGPFSSSKQAALTAAWNQGIVLVASAGNSGNTGVNYPAGYSEVISVASIDAADRHSQFSNYNSDVELAAPGEYIFSSVRGGGYDHFFGTSMAAPHVSGVAAMVISEFDFTNAETRTRLQETAVDLGNSGRDSLFGYGRVNLEGALQGAALAPPFIQVPSDGDNLSNPSVTITGSARPDASVTVSEGATTLGTTTVNGSGAWTLPYTFTDGFHSITATASHGGQTSAPSAPRGFTIDTVAPLAPVIDSPAEGALVNTRSVVLSGTSEPGIKVWLSENDTLIGMANADGSGNWTKTLTLTETSHTIVANGQDLAGNSGPVSAPRTFSVDAPPPVPVITYPSEAAHIGGPTIPVMGTAQPGSAINVTELGSTIGVTTTAANGQWSVDVTFANGNHTLSVTAADAGGTSLPATRSFASGPGPLTPVITGPAADSYNKSAVTITGTSELQTAIKVYEGAQLRGQATTRSDGKWTVTANFPTDGPHTIMVVAYDLSNTGSPAAFRSFVTDGTAPQATISGSTTQIRAGISIPLDGEASDNIGVARVQVKIVRPVGGTAADQDAECACGTTVTLVDWHADLVLLPGVYTAYVYSYDLVGNVSPAARVTLIVA